jgi:glycosyltransferase involved in cell wall biosynthesis
MRCSRLIKTGLARILQLTGTGPLENRWGEACAVFAFHRITDPADEAMFTSSTESMPLNLFEEFAVFIRRRYRPLDYSQFEEHLLSGAPFAKRSCLITFDDGWLDNYTNAWPILRAYELPALIFLPTSFIGSTRRFWQDELYAAFRALRDKRKKGPFFFEAHALGDIVYDLLEDPADRAWYYTREAVERLKHMEHEFSLKALESVLRYAYGIAGPPAAPRAFLSNEEVRRMAAGGVYFGSHSVNHRILPRLTDDELHEEIDRSREEIAAITGYRTTAFSYPNGDFDERVAGHVRRAGYTTGFTIEYGTVPASGNRFALRRIDMTPEMISCTPDKFASTHFVMETMPGMLRLKRRRQKALRKDAAQGERRIRLLFLIDEMQGEAGTEKQIVNLVRRLAPDKFEIHLACFSVSDWLRSLNLPCRIYDINTPSFWRPSAHLNILRFACFLRREKIDIIQTFFPAAHVVGVTTAFLARVPRIISSRRNFGHALTTTQKLTMMFINRLTHRILANSFSVKQRTIELESVRARQVDIIYNGVDALGTTAKDTVRRLTKADLGFTDQQPLVGIVANLRPVKGVRYFIEAAAIVHRSHPEARFVIFGFGDLMDELQQLTNDLKLADKVRFMGRTPSVAEYLPLLDIAVLSSLSEGFSNSILEYMAAGLPVVATAVGSNWETVDHGATGYLARPQDPANIAEQIVELLNNPEQRKRMGIEGKRRVLGSFSMERMVARYDEYYRYTLNTPYRERHFQV